MKSIRRWCLLGLVGLLPIDATALTDEEYLKIYNLFVSDREAASQAIVRLPDDDSDKYALRVQRDWNSKSVASGRTECERHVAIASAAGRPIRPICAAPLAHFYLAEANHEGAARMAQLALQAKSPQAISNDETRARLVMILIASRGLLVKSGSFKGQEVTFREIELFGKDLLGKQIAIRNLKFNNFSNFGVSDLPDVHIASNGLMTRYDADAAEQYAGLRATDAQGQTETVFVYKNPLKKILLAMRQGESFNCAGQVVELVGSARRAVICDGFAP
jgi:hypothetical protein